MSTSSIPTLRPVQTAHPANTIWSAISQDAFRENLVTLEKKTNAVPIDVLIAKVEETIDQHVPPGPRIPLHIEKQVADDLAYIAAVGEGAQSVAAVCLEQHIRTSASSKPDSNDVHPKNTTNLLVVKIAGMDIVDDKVKDMLQQIIDGMQDSSRMASARRTPESSNAPEQEVYQDAIETIFDLIITHHRQKLLGRLRSRKWVKPTYLDRTHKKPLWQDFANVVHRVQHVFPRKADWKVRKSVTESLQGLQEIYELFESTSEAETEEKLKELVKHSWEFCQRKDMGAFAEKLECGKAGKTAQVAAATKTLRQVEKVGTYWRIARDLVRVAGGSYFEAFGSIQLEFVNPYASVPTDITYEPWAGKCHVHAEVQLVVEEALAGTGWEGRAKEREEMVVVKPRIIGTSKYLCYLCYLFLYYHGGYEVLDTHGRLYDQWTVPDLAEYSPETRKTLSVVLEEMNRHISRQIADTKGSVWRAEPMTSRQNLLSCDAEKENGEESMGKLNEGLGSLTIDS
ncbi:hypothetical protein CB0940_05571 [Cercospora beticola]|uniref:Uncharacterized protein n=1 Tax=Cercospora beticola TaxID=122368 RepID=A0A2G5HYD8_CERBT|nr:hypothetical protein CB0940_05571 [Cercospora beticola]PIA97262.1 hypothetical protein CB0940_05571 [Cercospora beticola]WPA98132.1 hypothetical protein RHO25_002743 [Cercospora beticola]CAK1359345.1 unnamed protein product [Cercospora beticola]